MKNKKLQIFFTTMIVIGAVMIIVSLFLMDFNKTVGVIFTNLGLFLVLTSNFINFSFRYFTAKITNKDDTQRLKREKVMYIIMSVITGVALTCLLVSIILSFFNI